MKVNWKVRVRNQNFWLTVIPATLLLAQLVLDLFGVKMDFGDLGNKLKAIVNALFSLLTICGVVNDPTTIGLGDSERALGYEEPWVDIPDEEPDTEVK